MSDRNARVRIDWMLHEDVPVEGVRGIKGEYVRLEDLVKWARRRRKKLRRDIAKARVIPPEPPIDCDCSPLLYCEHDEARGVTSPASTEEV